MGRWYMSLSETGCENMDWLNCLRRECHDAFVCEYNGELWGPYKQRIFWWAAYQLFNKCLVTLAECTFSTDVSHFLDVSCFLCSSTHSHEGMRVGGEMQVFSGRHSVEKLGNVCELSESKLCWGSARVPWGKTRMAVKLLFSVSVLFSHYSDRAMGWTTRVWLPAGTVISLCHNVQIGSWSHPASYIMGTRGSLLLAGIKCWGHESDHSPPSSVKVKTVWSYTSIPPIHPHGVVFC